MSTDTPHKTLSICCATATYLTIFAAAGVRLLSLLQDQRVAQKCSQQAALLGQCFAAQPAVDRMGTRFILQKLRTSEHHR